jgi:hypothetical protein
MTQKRAVVFLAVLGLGALAACSPSDPAAEAAVTDTGAIVTLADTTVPAAPVATKTRALPAPRTLSSGRQFSISTTEAISSRTARAGDAFAATVVIDVVDEAGRVAIPAGSLVSGTITEVKSAPNSRTPGTLTLVVNGVTVRGKDYRMEARIDSLATERAGRPISGSDAAKVGIGAAAGAIVGQVITKDTKGTIIGAVVGAAAGAGVAMATKDSDIRLPAGTNIIITLTERLTIAGS